MSDKLEFHGEEPPELKSEVPKLTAKETADMMARLEAARLAAKREPLLSDAELARMWALGLGAKGIRDWYEHKIASGELRVVKKAQWYVGVGDYGEPVINCNSCFGPVDMDDFYCRNCGAELTGKQGE